MANALDTVCLNVLDAAKRANRTRLRTGVRALLSDDGLWTRHLDRLGYCGEDLTSIIETSRLRIKGQHAFAAEGSAYFDMTRLTALKEIYMAARIRRYALARRVADAA